MKFLLDHDVPVDISYSLTELGPEVVRLPEVLDPSASDEQVLQYASRNGYVLITCNREDFLQLAQRKPHCGLIILIRRKSRAAERAALIRLIDKAGEDGIRSNVNFA
jgi:predicted nuclease of predicted toxin-antitoxin system